MQFGLALNSSKIKVMKIVKNNQNTKDADHIIVNSYEISDHWSPIIIMTPKEICQRLCIARSAMVLLTNIWKDKSITITTKVRLLHT